MKITKSGESIIIIIFPKSDLLGLSPKVNRRLNFFGGSTEKSSDGSPPGLIGSESIFEGIRPRSHS